MDRNNPIIKTLLESSEEFKGLFREHLDLEEKLAALDSIHYLSPEQEIERKRIQKLKLKGRDRMEDLIQQAGT
jgi:uncharacterized protein YdcH (DUF465 family)